MTTETIINANNAILGRIASLTAKRLLSGEQVIIVNSNEAIITGNRKDIIEKYNRLRNKGGHSQKGPQISKVPYMLMKRAVKGMLPDFRKGIGKEAIKRLKCYDDIPEEYQDKEMVKFDAPNHDKFITLKGLTDKL